MAFCTKCGKQLNEGETCSCEATSKKAVTNIDVTAEANGIIGYVKDIIADPQNGAKKFVAGISWVTMIIVSAIYALLTVLIGVWNKLKSNMDIKERYEEIADDFDMDLDEYMDEFDIDLGLYEFGDFIKGIFMDILQVAAGIAITAVVFYFAVKLIKKIQITWKTAFAIAVIELLVIIPFTLGYRVLDFIPDFKLLSWIMSAIWSVQAWGSTILTYLGLKSVCGDTKSTVYVAVPAIAVCSIASSLVTFLLTSLF